MNQWRKTFYLMFSVCIFVLFIILNLNFYNRSYNILFFFFNKLFVYVLFADVDVPVVYLNDEWVYGRIDIQEGKLLHLSCFVDGNPTPTVRIGKSRNGRTVILSEAMDQWSNFRFSTGAKCSDTGTYICYGESTNQKTNKAIEVNILCKSFILHVVNRCTIEICLTVLKYINEISHTS